MTESEVWNASIKHLNDNSFTVICGSPPGATSYAYRNCLLNFSNKNDAPDIIFLKDNKMYICECKPSFYDFNKRNVNGENDFEKLKRMIESAKNGYYNNQLMANYMLDPQFIDVFLPCLAYYSESENIELMRDFAHLIIRPEDVQFKDSVD